MSIATEIQRIKDNIVGSYAAAQTKGAILPQIQNSDNLADTIATIASGGEIDEYANVISVENLMRGTAEVEATVLGTACNDISQFLYGTDN